MESQMGNVFEPISDRRSAVFEPVNAGSARARGSQSTSHRTGVFEPVSAVPVRTAMVPATAEEEGTFTRVLKGAGTLASVINCAVGVYKLIQGDPSGVHHLTGSGDGSS